jgi:hypothetical protein
MPRFIVTRTLPPLNEEQLQAVGKSVISACDQLGMQWIRSHVTADGKHSYCEFEAPSGDVCREHASRAGLPVDDVIAVGMEIGPDQFK